MYVNVCIYTDSLLHGCHYLQHWDVWLCSVCSALATYTGCLRQEALKSWGEAGGFSKNRVATRHSTKTKRVGNPVYAQTHRDAQLESQGGSSDLQVIIDSALAGNTTADECTWTLSDGVLQAGDQALKSMLRLPQGPLTNASVLGLGQTGVISCWKGNSGEGWWRNLDRISERSCSFWKEMPQ